MSHILNFDARNNIGACNVHKFPYIHLTLTTCTRGLPVSNSRYTRKYREILLLGYAKTR